MKAAMVMLAGLLVAAPAGAQDNADREWMVDLSTDLTECAGYHYATSDRFAQAGMADEAQLAQDYGNGAVMAASWVLVLLEVMNPLEAVEYVEKNAAGRLAHWRARFKDRNNAMIEKQWADCDAIGPYQEELVKQARRAVLLNRPRPTD